MLIYTFKDTTFTYIIKPIFPVNLIHWFVPQISFPVGIYLFKVNNENTGTMCEICSKLTIKTPEQCHWSCSAVFIVNFEQISRIVLVFPLLTLNKWIPARLLVSIWYISLNPLSRYHQIRHNNVIAVFFQCL